MNKSDEIILTQPTMILDLLPKYFIEGLACGSARSYTSRLSREVREGET
jgi:hypothetical protein